MSAEAAPEAGPGDRFLLEIPSEAANVSTARLFAAAIARQFGCEEETVENLKLAVSEACTMAVRAPRAGPVRVAAARDGQSLAFEITDVGPPVSEATPEAGEATPESFSRSTSFDIIGALFDDARVSPFGDHGGRLTFSLALGG